MESSEYPTKLVGEYEFNCAICGTPIPIPIYACIEIESASRKVFIRTAPDTSVIWMHLWTEHPEYADQEERRD